MSINKKWQISKEICIEQMKSADNFAHFSTFGCAIPTKLQFSSRLLPNSSMWITTTENTISSDIETPF